MKPRKGLFLRRLRLTHGPQPRAGVSPAPRTRQHQRLANSAAGRAGAGRRDARPYHGLLPMVLTAFGPHMKTCLKFFCGLLLFSGVARSAFGGVVINEIMYHPASTNVLEEWVELLNTGTTNVNLSGWRFTRGVHFTFPTNTTLAAGAYIVVAADAATFAAKHPGTGNVAPGSAGPIVGHTLELDDVAGQKINSVTYSGDGDWAVRQLGPVSYDHQGWEWYAGHDGLGCSLELINPALPNQYAHNWGSSSAPGGTPGGPNSIAAANVAPLISGVAHSDRKSTRLNSSH